MKYFNLNVGNKPMPNYILMLISVLIATSMWYYVRFSNEMETQIPINLDFSGIPANLIITAGLQNDMTVRLRGPERLIRSIPPEMRTLTVNLSMIKKGATVVPIMGSREIRDKYRAFTLIAIEPPSLTIVADTIAEKNVKIEVQFDKPQGQGLPVPAATTSPSSTTLRGPQSVLNNISVIPINITLDPNADGQKIDEMMPIVVPNLVTANPSAVRVAYTYPINREVVRRQCMVTLLGGRGSQYKVDPASFTLTLEVPKKMLNNQKYLDQVRLTATVPQQLGPDESKMAKLEISLPPDMVLASPINGDVRITRLP